MRDDSELMHASCEHVRNSLDENVYENEEIDPAILNLFCENEEIDS